MHDIAFLFTFFFFPTGTAFSLFGSPYQPVSAYLSLFDTKSDAESSYIGSEDVSLSNVDSRSATPFLCFSLCSLSSVYIFHPDGREMDP